MLSQLCPVDVVCKVDIMKVLSNYVCIFLLPVSSVYCSVYDRKSVGSGIFLRCRREPLEHVSFAASRLPIERTDLWNMLWHIVRGIAKSIDNEVAPLSTVIIRTMRKVIRTNLLILCNSLFKMENLLKDTYYCIADSKAVMKSCNTTNSMYIINQ